MTAFSHNFDVIGAELAGIQAMLTMELAHYKDGQYNPILIDRISKPFIVNTIAKIGDYLKESEHAQLEIKDTVIKTKLEKCINQFSIDKDMLNKLLQELS